MKWKYVFASEIDYFDQDFPSKVIYGGEKVVEINNSFIAKEGERWVSVGIPTGIYTDEKGNVQDSVRQSIPRGCVKIIAASKEDKNRYLIAINVDCLELSKLKEKYNKAKQAFKNKEEKERKRILDEWNKHREKQEQQRKEELEESGEQLSFL